MNDCGSNFLLTPGSEKKDVNLVSISGVLLVLRWHLKILHRLHIP
jgi:hypothetical protein